MTPYSDVTVNVLDKLSPSKHDILLKRKFVADQFLTKDLGLKIYGTEFIEIVQIYPL